MTRVRLSFKCSWLRRCEVPTSRAVADHDTRRLASCRRAGTRRLEPDGLLSLAAELVAPDIGGHRDGGTERPARRWSPRDPLHEQCAAPGRALTVAPTGLTFHHPDGEDIAVRVLSAVAFPEVWPGWRGNALIGDFHRDFLQPGAPVLTCLTVVTGDEAAGEKAFLKSARATQQAGTGIARYLPGLPEKARDWQAVTERIKDGEKLVRACYTVAVYAPLDALDEAEQGVRAIYHGQGWRVTQTVTKIRRGGKKSIPHESRLGYNCACLLYATDGPGNCLIAGPISGTNVGA